MEEKTKSWKKRIDRTFGPLLVKLGGILFILLFLKLLMIGTGFFAAKHLMGDAIAINYAGSERMRSFKIGLLLDKWFNSVNMGRYTDAHEALEIAQEEIERFEKVLYGLRDGSTEYGLPRVRDAKVIKQLNRVIEEWSLNIKPLLEGIVRNTPKPESASPLLSEYKNRVYDFVIEIDKAVILYEQYSTWKVKVFDFLQYVFLLLTVLFTLLAIYLIFCVIKRPLRHIQDTILRITAGDFGARVKIKAHDEIGELANGFNYMAKKLEESYSNLESSVNEKTRALKEKNRALSILYDIASSTSTTFPINELLEGFLEKLLSLLNAKAGAVRLFDNEKSELHLLAHKGLSKKFVREEGTIPLNECTCGTSISESRIIFLDHCSGCLGITLKRCRREGFASMMVVPLRYQSRVLGTFNLYFDTSYHFRMEESELLDSIGSHLGMAIESNRLQAKALRLAAMEERVLIANELHDSIAQSLAFLKIQGKLLEDSLNSSNIRQSVEDLKQMRRGIEECNQNVRELLVHFRTRIDSEGLEVAIRKYLLKFKQETGIETIFEADGDTPTISSDAEIHVFHIIQEALSNVRKYADASMVKVFIGGNGCFEVAVEDDGKGFDVDEVKSRGFARVGLDIMRERANRLKGRLRIESDLGKGTRIRLMIP